MIDEESALLYSGNCFVCAEPISKTDEIEFLDKTCFVTAHKRCTKDWVGSCPVCGKKVESKKSVCADVMYYGMLICVGTVFSIGMLSFSLMIAFGLIK